MIGPLVAAAFLNPIISDVLYVLVAALWLIPDKRAEAALRTAEK